jgi:hypothetical protein
MTTYTADEFVKELASSEGLALPTPPVVQTGMVDAAKSSDEEVSFAPGTQCSNWIKVPVSMIEEVDHLRNQRCGRDEYPYVRLHLKSPGTKEGDAVFQALAGMLQHGIVSSTPQRGTAPSSMMAPTSPMMAPTRHVPTTPAPTTSPARGRVPSPGRGYAAPTTSSGLKYVAPTPPNMPGPTIGCGD